MLKKVQIIIVVTILILISMALITTWLLLNHQSNMFLEGVEKTRNLTFSQIGEINNLVNQNREGITVTFTIITVILIIASIGISKILEKCILAPTMELVKNAEMIIRGESLEKKYLKADVEKDQVDELVSMIVEMDNNLKERLEETTRQKGEIETILLHMKDGVISFDIKGRISHINKAAKENIKIKEKELMLKSVAIKEIHHRIKNNLQTIASLLRMQARKAEDESVKKILNDSINRILSISITHEMLAQNGFDNLKIQEVIKKILRNSVRENINENLNLKISIEGDDFQINSDKATTIALIINELIENSVKHAFKNKKCGTIIVGIKNEGEKAKISVVDNGIGMEIRKTKKNSLGLQIVKSLVKDKLDGDLNIKSDNNGTNISFDVKLDQN